MISIYQRSVPAHPIKRMGRADPTICIAGCSKGGRGKTRQGNWGRVYTFREWRVRLGVSKKRETSHFRPLGDFALSHGERAV
jgi:hypothetical protein